MNKFFPISGFLDTEFSSLVRGIVIKDKEIEISIFYSPSISRLLFFKHKSENGFSIFDLLSLVYYELKDLSNRLNPSEVWGLWDYFFEDLIIKDIYYYPQEKRVSSL